MFTFKDAKIECIVVRPFYYNGHRKHPDEIFFMNPNMFRERTLLRNGLIKKLSEEEYVYILCSRTPKNYNDKVFQNGDIVDVSNLTIEQRENRVKQGQFKKAIKDNFKPKEIKETEQQTEPQEFQMPVFEESSNLSKLTKQVGEHFNKSAKDIKILAEEKLDIKLGSYTQKLTEEQFNKILELLNSEKESGE